MLKFEEILRFMMEKKAPEIHIVPGSPIMFRDKSGTLNPIDATILTPGDTKKFASDLMNPDQKADFAQKNEIDFAYSVPGLSRYRINVMLQRNSMTLMIRTVPPSPPTFDELQLPEIIKNLAMRATKGFVIICGPKQSGKSSTLAAILNYILETKMCKVVTLENPIKYLFKNRKGIIVQRELGIDAKDFRTAFDSLPRMGADVIVVNDIESFEVAHPLLSMAAGGQLVFATTNAPSVGIILEKLIDLYPVNLQGQCKTLLAVGLEAIVVQTMLNKASGDGVVPVFEILLATPQVKMLLKEGKIFQLSAVMSTGGRDAGMSTQEHALRLLIKKNIVTAEEAYSKAVRPEELRKIMALPF
jgi:twitching motility protein PilT